MNEIFALHLEGQLLTAQNREDLWKQYSKRYGDGMSGLYGWRAPKPYYSKIGYAKRGVSHLPKQVQDAIEIVRYVPESKKEIDQ